MTQQLIILRGIPGSGKSTLAREMLADGQADAHFEADQYFYQRGNGVYDFDPTLLPNAHNKCLVNTRNALEEGKSVVVSNTFVKREQMIPYLMLAQKLGCKARVIKCCGNFTSIHGVPDEIIQKMRDEWEDVK